MTNIFLAGILLALPILAVIVAPFWATYQRTMGATQSQTRDLDDQLQRMVSAVRDLDFDFDTGKVSEEDYITQRKLLVGRGVSTLLKLREVRQVTLQTTEDELERLIAAYQTKKPLNSH